MQLFAIIASIDKSTNDKSLSESKEILKSFLLSELSSTYIDRYLTIFGKNLEEVSKNYISDKKDDSLISLKILKICDEINNELTHRQKIIVILRIIEFIDKSDDLYKNTTPFIDVIADSFHITLREYNLLLDFITNNGKNIDEPIEIINYTDNDGILLEQIKTENNHTIYGNILVVRIASIQTLFFKYIGDDDLYQNGQMIDAKKIHILNSGSTIRTSRSKQLFYSDILSKLTGSENKEHFNYKINNLFHTFKNSEIAVRNFDFEINSGNLVGIMGASGVGKSTLLNLMNGSQVPKFGNIEINGLDIHTNREELKGCIGNVSQTDTLIENLTVYENLYLSAQLSLNINSQTELKKKAIDLLKKMGLYDIRHSKVGSLLRKEISGGQRKRLNIALELIREPSILFVDEPTSGLSSRDSEKIMDILKDVALSGKLVFIVVHQPSSDIFKLFDRLLIMDFGGYLIYDGIPLNAIEHFKKHTYKGNHKEKECSLCGNVNPEQIFNLTDAKIVDEYGQETNERKLNPEDWYKLYKLNKPKFDVLPKEGYSKIRAIELPRKISQFLTYFTRDAKTKYSNFQYVALNLMIAPFLALILSYFIKYYDNFENGQAYSLYDNENIPQYLFILIIVGVFLGLNVSAEEINKDKKILFRESYLQLSRRSYLLAKISVLFLISLVQSFLFVLVGNFIMQIGELFWSYWMMMFVTTCFSNILGLIISSSFRSTKVIYIAIPLVIIPQLLFSGAIVDFKNLHPSIAKENKVPTIGNMMVTRWAYEGLVVEQMTRNSYINPILQDKIAYTNSEWKKNYWVPELENQLKQEIINTNLVRREVQKINNEVKESDLKSSIDEILQKKTFNPNDLIELKRFVELIGVNASYNLLSDTVILKSDFEKEHTNKALSSLTLSSKELLKYKVSDYQINSYYKPIYTLPEKGQFNTHLFSPVKYVFGYQLRTYTANILIIVIYTLIGYFILYYDLLTKFLQQFSKLKKFRAKKTVESI